LPRAMEHEAHEVHEDRLGKPFCCQSFLTRCSGQKALPNISSCPS
jgi:hypothetical protein